MTNAANLLLAAFILALGYCTLQHVDVSQDRSSITFRYHECYSVPDSNPWPAQGAKRQPCPPP